MRILLYYVLVLGAFTYADLRTKRQASYLFPGPRGEGGRRQAQAQAQAPHQARAAARAYVDEENEAELYQTNRRQYQPQQQHAHPPQYTHSAQPRAAPVPPPNSEPVYETSRQAAPPQQRQSYAPAPTQRKRAAASTRATKYGAAPQQSLNAADDDEIEEGPDPLTLLLEDSKFTCGGKTDGYYADDSVNCHVFHYCVGGARHSWMCPAGTLFHQVHLNCVPEGQDICAQSEKFHFVNDYLYKPIDYKGPNNTARYAQRYYPDGYVVGDPLHSPSGRPAPQVPAAGPTYRAQPAPQPQAYPAPVARPQTTRQLAPAPPPHPPTYGAQSPSYGHSAEGSSARSHRPSRPAQAYQGELPPGYRVVTRQEQPQHASEEEHYQPPPPEPRRHASPPRGGAGYSPPRPQYRSTSAARAPAQAAAPRAQYPPGYASNQASAAGVQYDEDY